ncbi:cell growth-regulating nucleolar protein-like [Dreissena polymorpha]|uniref:Cell growth-regulating nucleolar protein n=1 Tax=Dreissena polymorpha TaxID=45954 RepID=A0A9D4IUV5_DREPO|nr:cell growth-regulating nucleolar protein-like [Dreissena polymorpha]KAH3785632.1 hypothetical protein DPMN_163725 [Dreissena polymorpha]
MVVFNCNACGEALKKNQVEKHYMTKCRSCNVLSCIDCGKDFWGNDYEQHTKCISEEEKYSGKNFVPKPGQNKNEVKQLQWLQQVQLAIDKAKTNPQLRDLLVRLRDYPNIPRKQNKFINFLANSIKCRNPKVCNEAWKVLMENVEMPPKPAENGVNSKESAANSETKTADVVSETSSSAGRVNAVNGETTEIDTHKLSKREKKEERKMKAHKNEKKEKFVETNNEIKETSKKGKKRKKDALEDDEEEEVTSQDDSRLVSDAEIAEEESSEPVRKKFKTKFNWAEVILEVVQSKGTEMKMKRLKKKVLAEYLSQGCTERSEEKLWAKFDKRLKRHPNIKILGDKVKLINMNV